MLCRHNRGHVDTNGHVTPVECGCRRGGVWIALDDADLLLGKQLRTLRAGTAYKVPPTGIIARANINLTNKPARFLHISTAR